MASYHDNDELEVILVSITFVPKSLRPKNILKTCVATNL